MGRPNRQESTVDGGHGRVGRQGLDPGRDGRKSWLALGVALWGLHLGLTQGLLSALVADTALADLRGTAFGLFNFVSGIGMLASNVLAGALWKTAGPRAAFAAAGSFDRDPVVDGAHRARPAGWTRPHRREHARIDNQDS